MKVVLVSCVKTKRDGKHAARKLYNSHMFHLMMKYAEKLNPDRTYIISAKHGLVPLNKQISNYNQTLQGASMKEKLAWGDVVIHQLKRAGINPVKDEITILAGRSYVDGLKGRISNLKDPMKGLSMGERIQWLQARVGK